jgi:hypothetical protein
VCREALVEGDVRTTQFGCGHRFHSHCVYAWLVSGADSCPECRAVVLDTADGALRDRYDARLLERATGCMYAALLWATALVVTPITALAYMLSVAYHLAWLVMAVAATTLLYCAFFALWFAWVLDRPLLQGSALCLTARAAYPAVEMHGHGFLDAFSEKSNVASDPGVWLLLLAVREGLRAFMACVRQIATSYVLCGAVT